MSPHFHTQTQTLTPASLPPCLPARKRKPSGGSEVPATTFADVAGMNAAKRELAEVRGLQLLCHSASASFLCHMHLCLDVQSGLGLGLEWGCWMSRITSTYVIGCAIRAGAGAGAGAEPVGCEVSAGQGAGRGGAQVVVQVRSVPVRAASRPLWPLAFPLLHACLRVTPHPSIPIFCEFYIILYYAPAPSAAGGCLPQEQQQVCAAGGPDAFGGAAQRPTRHRQDPVG